MSSLRPQPQASSPQAAQPLSQPTFRSPLRRDLQLDFLRKGPVTPLLSWVLLGLGMVVLIAMIGLDQVLTQKIAQERQVVARLTQSGGGAGRTATDNRLLSKPWGSLFISLEQSRPDAIALIQLEASGQTGQLSLLAETQSAEDMLDYVKQLREQRSFSNVTLVRHTTLDNESDRPIQFAVRLGWAAP